MEQGAGPREQLAHFFADLGDQVDDEVEQYLLGVLGDEDADADDLSDSIAGFSPAFARLPPPKQRQLCGDLLQRAQACRQQEQQQQARPAAGGGAAAKPALAAIASEALQRLGSLSVSSSAASSERDESEDDEEGRALASAEQAAAVTALRELCAVPDDSSGGGGTCDAFLAHVLSSKGGGDVQAAAAWLLECPDLAAAQKAWQAARQAARAERARARAEREAAKREIVSRFQLQAVPNGGPGKGGKPAALRGWGAGGENASKARYRDGMLVSNRGEKYVVEKGAEWDGGSRGKVYTKGKRGKGFI